MALLVGVAALWSGCSLSQRAPSGVAKISISGDLKQKLQAQSSRAFSPNSTQKSFFVVDVEGEGIPSARVRGEGCLGLSNSSALTSKEQLYASDLTLEVPVGKNRQVRILLVQANSPDSLSLPVPEEGESARAWFQRTGAVVSALPEILALGLIEDLNSDQTVDLMLGRIGWVTCNGVVGAYPSPSPAATPEEVLQPAYDLWWRNTRSSLTLNVSFYRVGSENTLEAMYGADPMVGRTDEVVYFRGKNCNVELSVDPVQDFSAQIQGGPAPQDYSFRVKSSISGNSQLPVDSNCSNPVRLLSAQPTITAFEVYHQLNGIWTKIQPGTAPHLKEGDSLLIGARFSEAVVFGEKTSLLLALNNAKETTLSLTPRGRSGLDEKIAIGALWGVFTVPPSDANLDGNTPLGVPGRSAVFSPPGGLDVLSTPIDSSSGVYYGITGEDQAYFNGSVPVPDPNAGFSLEAYGIVIDTEIPAVPNASVDSSGKISWNGTADSSGFYRLRLFSDSQCMGSPSLIDPIDRTDYQPGSQAGSFQIQAVDPAGNESAWSECAMREVTAPPPQDVLPPKAILHFSPSGENVVYGDVLTLTWSYPGESAASHATGIESQTLSWFSGPGCSTGAANPIPNLPKSIRAHSLGTKVAPGDYSFQLTTFNASGQQATSDCIRGRLLAPKPVSLVSGGMAIGANHTCVLSDGKVYCWGKNDRGQLGDGDPLNSAAHLSMREFPRPVIKDDGSILEGVEKIASSKNHTCAVRAGRAYCWGANEHLQLGAGVDDRPVAREVRGPSNSDLFGVQEISTGADHTCAIVNGGIWCWGGNSHGQIGVGATSGNTAIPVPITVPYPSANTPVSGASKVAAGDSFTCAVFDGHVRCWGKNDQGQCGRSRANGNADVNDPEVITSDPHAQELVAGASHACILSDGKIRCWGSNSSGQSGLTGINSDVPVELRDAGGSALQNFQKVYAGGDSSCGLKNGQIFCWGRGADGQLGTGMAQDSLGVAFTSSAYDHALGFGIGFGHSCAITEAGMFCSGKNESNQLGHLVVPPAASLGPIKFDAFTPGLQMVATGRDFTCILAKGQVWCAGKNDLHQLGNSDTANVNSSALPVQVKMQLSNGTQVPLNQVTSITAGANHVCAIRDGGLWCWGRVFHPTASPPSTPLTLASRRRVAAITAQTVPDVISNVAMPFFNVATGDSTAVGDLSTGVYAISSSFDHSCVIKNGLLLCWGANAFGQLGNGTMVDQPLPTGVRETAATALPLSGVSSVSAGKDHTCAIASGILLCFGSNLSGQLGNGTQTGTNIASVKPLLPNNSQLIGVQSVSAGDAHTCAVVNGDVMCWGANGSSSSQIDGRLGDGQFGPRTTVPPPVIQGGVSSLVAGSTFTLAVTSGGVYGFGNNNQGQLGLGGSQISSGVIESNLSPILIEGSGVLQVSAGGFHSCAIAGNQVYCTGSNSFGQLGRSDIAVGNETGNFGPISAPWEPIP